MTASSNDCDIAIVGGGLVGVPLALALDKAGWTVTLLERESSDSRGDVDPLDQRCTALSAGTVDWLRRQALWSSIADDACPIRRVHVSQRGFFGATRLLADELGVDALGHVVDNRRMLSVLDRQLDASDVRRLAGRAFVNATDDTDGVMVEHEPTLSPRADAPDSLRARLVIGVDGVQSAVRESLGIGVHRHDYRQWAILGTLRLQRDHGSTACERFTDTGPLALLPRPGRHMSFVECVDPDASDRLAALDTGAYLDHLQARFGHRLGPFVACGPRTLLPLVRSEADRQVGPRCVLLGNAARLLHPVAGQGYNLALRDVAGLLRLLGRGGSSAPRNGSHINEGNGPDNDPGRADRLAAFVAERRSDQRRVVAITDALVHSFRGRSVPLAHLRALALVGLDAVPPLRHRFAALAMGLDRQSVQGSSG